MGGKKTRGWRRGKRECRENERDECVKGKKKDLIREGLKRLLTTVLSAIPQAGVVDG